MLLNLILLAFGLAILVIGAEAFVRGSVALARLIGVSTLLVGLTVVAVGTSAPELAVNLLSALRGSPGLALGNVFGSNLANTLLILGMAALWLPVVIKREVVWRLIPFGVMASIVAVALGADGWVGGGDGSLLSRLDGLVLLIFGAAFMYYSVRTAKHRENLKDEILPVSRRRIAAYIIGGLGGLVLGGEAIVRAATFLASAWGVSEGLVGMTIVAIGTSLPELATTVAAVRHRHDDIAVGNIVGSNVLNVFLVLGATAAVHPLTFGIEALRYGLLSALASLLLFVAMFVGTRHRLDRWQGALFIAAYLGILAFSFV